MAGLHFSDSGVDNTINGYEISMDGMTSSSERREKSRCT